MSDPGVTTWTTTRLQLINALRDRKVLASTPVLEGDEALAAMADAILACLPEAAPRPDAPTVPVESAFPRLVLTESAFERILAATDEHRASGLRELADARDRADRAEAALAAIRSGVSPATVFYAEAAASDLAQERVERAERVTTGAQPVAEGDGKPAGSAEAQRGSQPRGWDQ